MTNQTQTPQHGGARNGAGRKSKAPDVAPGAVAQLELERAELEKRATELCTKRDDAARESEALDARLAQGEFDRAGDAANKRAELDAIGRALDGVERDADAVREQIAEAEAEAAKIAELTRLQTLARDIVSLDAEAHKAALELAAQIEARVCEIAQTRERAHILREQIRRVHVLAPAIVQKALSPQLQAAIGYGGSYSSWIGFNPPSVFPNGNGDLRAIGETAVATSLANWERKKAGIGNQIPQERIPSILDPK